MVYIKSDIGQFKLGSVVEIADNLVKPDEVGHVTGLGLNDYKEVCVLVKLATGEERLFHPIRLEIL